MRGRPPTQGYLLRTFAAAVLAFSQQAGAADFVVIANPSVPVNSISTSDLRAVYLGDKTRWPDSSQITFVVLDSGAANKSFMTSALGKTQTQYDNYWRRLLFSGKGTTPPHFNDPAELAAFVAHTPGAIGFVPETTLSSNVKTLNIK